MTESYDALLYNKSHTKTILTSNETTSNRSQNTSHLLVNTHKLKIHDSRNDTTYNTPRKTTPNRTPYYTPKHSQHDKTQT